MLSAAQLQLLHGGGCAALLLMKTSNACLSAHLLVAKAQQLCQTALRPRRQAQKQQQQRPRHCGSCLFRAAALLMCWLFQSNPVSCNAWAAFCASEATNRHRAPAVASFAL